MDIILVEDRIEESELVTMAIENLNFNVKVHWIQNGEDALTYFFEEGYQERVTDTQLILLDINLPKVNGLEILKRLKNSDLKHIPVVVFTTSREPWDVKQAYELYANSYIEKPSGHDEFEKLVADMVGYWLQINVPHDRYG